MVNFRELELTNATGLDGYYNSDGNGANSISPETIQQGANATADIISMIKNRDTSSDEIKSACGKRPIIGKKKKQAYQNCVDNFLKSKTAVQIAAIKAAQNKAAEEYKAKATALALEKLKNKDSKKFIGMPMGVGITLMVVLAAGLSFGAYKLIKK